MELGLIRVEKHRSESSRSAPIHALAVAHAGNGQTGTTGTRGGTRGRGRKGRRSGGRHDDRGGRYQQGHPQHIHQQHQHQQHQPPAAMSQQSYAWQQQQQQQDQPPFSQGPHHHQPNPRSSWERPPHQQQRGRAHHQGTPRHRGGHQTHQQRVMCTQCGKEEHFPAGCVITMPAPAPQYTATFSGARPAQYSTGAHAAQQYSTGAHVAQYGTHPLPTWTPSDSNNQSTHSFYGPPSNEASFHQPSRCHRRYPDLSGRHLHWTLLRILIGASLPNHPKLYRHNTCLQASFRVRV